MESSHSAMVVGVDHLELLEATARSVRACTAIAHSRRGAQGARAYAEREGFSCRVLLASNTEALTDRDTEAAGAPFDVVVLDRFTGGVGPLSNAAGSGEARARAGRQALAVRALRSARLGPAIASLSTRSRAYVACWVRQVFPANGSALSKPMASTCLPPSPRLLPRRRPIRALPDLPLLDPAPVTAHRQCITANEDVSEYPHAISVSFEFFPPADVEMDATLWKSVQRLAPLAPRFVSVTYGADGSTRERTHSLVTRINRETPLTGAPHLTCVGASRGEVLDLARRYWDEGIRPRRRIARRSGEGRKRIRAAPGRICVCL